MTDTWQHLTPYQEAWKDEFEGEKTKLQSVFGVSALEIEHIGSTSIEGMPSRPIIDIAVMIESYKDADGFNDALIQIGYEPPPPPHGNSKGGERYFYIKRHPPKCHLSVAFADQGGFWHRQIVFRDYLRANPAAHEEYARLKETLLHKYPSGHGAPATGKGEYSHGKTEFVYRILRSAGWREGQLYRDEGSDTPSA